MSDSAPNGGLGALEMRPEGQLLVTSATSP